MPHLLRALTDDDAGVASAAVFALGCIRDARAVPHLVARLGGADPDGLTDALARFGDRAVAPLARLLRVGESAERRHAAEVLGAIGQAAGVPALAAALEDAEPDVRLAAVLALGAIPGTESAAAVEGAADAADPKVRSVGRRLATGRVTRRLPRMR